VQHVEFVEAFVPAVARLAAASMRPAMNSGLSSGNQMKPSMFSANSSGTGLRLALFIDSRMGTPSVRRRASCMMRSASSGASLHRRQERMIQL
jgi:hypothetical protein